MVSHDINRLLPSLPPDSDQLQYPRVVDGAAQRRSLGVLLIEDEPLMLKSVQRGLTEQGFTVWAAYDGREGVELYRAYEMRIDIVLSDVNLPALSGPETLTELRAINPLVRLCFMTGDTRTSTCQDLLRRGALCVFAKPIESIAAVAEELWELATAQPIVCAASDGVAATTESDADDVCTAHCGSARQTAIHRGILRLLRLIGVFDADASNSLQRLPSESLLEK